MPDSKITALTSISTSTDPANDPLVIVDVSDTSMAATGTTKKVTLNQLLGASGTATLASATIIGDLTVDTSTLKVDSANNRVGIGTASPTAGMALDIVSATSNNFVRFTDGVNATGYLGIRAASGAAYLHGNNNVVSLSCSTSNTTPTEQLRITNPGVFDFLDGAGGTRMTLNSTGLGIGVASPSFKLSAAGVSQFYAESDGIYASGNSAPDLYTIGVNYYNAAGTEGVKVSARPSWKIEHKNSSDALAYLDIGFRAASAAASAFTSRFSIDGTGNVIIGSAAVATTATNGFLYVTGCAGTPTGTPTSKTGRVPIVVDTTNNKLYFYSGGSWVAAN